MAPGAEREPGEHKQVRVLTPPEFAALLRGRQELGLEEMKIWEVLEYVDNLQLAEPAVSDASLADDAVD